jgi:hypothetical protein
MRFIDRTRELADLEAFWTSNKAECIPITGRRRVGKTFLLERFASDKRAVYYRCQLKASAEQLPQLGAALAQLSGDELLRIQPPATWAAVFALIERLTRTERLLLVLDEAPYWAARDESLPSTLQNWWDERGRHLDVMLVLCGSAVQMMEKLLTGEAPLAGCVTGRLVVRPFDFRSVAEMVGYTRAEDVLVTYGILGGSPFYLGFFRAERSLRDNILHAIASPSARLYVEPQALFAAYHRAYESAQALAVLRAIAHGKHRWSEIAQAPGVAQSSLARVMEPLIGDLGLVERLLPVTESHPTRTYYTQYRLTDHFFRFWFRFIEPNQGHIEFGDAERVVDAILTQLSDYMGWPFETMCRDWTRLASAAGALPVRVGRVGIWWIPDHELDVVGLDEAGQVAAAGEAKWHNTAFDWEDLAKYLGHTRALGARLRPDAAHLLFSRSGHTQRVKDWAASNGAILLDPQAMLKPFQTRT